MKTEMEIITSTFLNHGRTPTENAYRHGRPLYAQVHWPLQVKNWWQSDAFRRAFSYRERVAVTLYWLAQAQDGSHWILYTQTPT